MSKSIHTLRNAALALAARRLRDQQPHAHRPALGPGPRRGRSAGTLRPRRLGRAVRRPGEHPAQRSGGRAPAAGGQPHVHARALPEGHRREGGAGAGDQEPRGHAGEEPHRARRLAQGEGRAAEEARRARSRARAPAGGELRPRRPAGDGADPAPGGREDPARVQDRVAAPGGEGQRQVQGRARARRAPAKSGAESKKP